jgi:hypothetical protein
MKAYRGVAVKLHHSCGHWRELSGQFHDPVALPSVSIGQEAGWAPEPVWMQGQIFPLAGIQTRRSSYPDSMGNVTPRANC